MRNDHVYVLCIYIYPDGYIFANDVSEALIKVLRLLLCIVSSFPISTETGAAQRALIPTPVYFKHRIPLT